MKQQKIRKWPVFPRRHFLKTILGLLGGLSVPVWAKRKKIINNSSLREAEFYRPREDFGENKKRNET